MYVCKNMCTSYNFKCMKCMYGVSVFLYARTLETSGSSGLKFKSAAVYRSMHAVCKPRRIADAHTQRFIEPKVWVEVCLYACMYVYVYVCSVMYVWHVQIVNVCMVDNVCSKLCMYVCMCACFK
jgi:hypothetical protein